MSEPETGLRLLLKALNKLGIPFLIGGSVASSVHGMPRATMDVDLVVDLKPENIASLAEELGSGFYVDVEALKNAVRTGRPFNVIHYVSSYKFDLFPLSTEAFLQSEFGRRTVVRTDVTGAGRLEFPVATAEDTILAKLSWYRAGAEVSSRQWDDVLGILRVRRGRLDMAYLRQWSQHLHVEHLLDRALAEVS
jgi:hypothetical protein